MKSAFVAVALVASALAIAGCATSAKRPIDAVGDTPVFVPKDGYSVRMPVGWGLLAPDVARMTAVNGGADLSTLTFELLRPEQVDYRAFREMSSLTPRQAAERYVAAPVRDVDALYATLESAAPATLGGCRGFRVEYVQEVWGLRYRRLVYGWVTTRGLYTLAFQAPVLHFYERDLPLAEAAMRSIAPPPPKSPIRCVSPAS